ncbi:hypothetical protein C7974DRAFT_445297 [Boeremia exigua]|uniref:uncharacterized protein n=1 Tax=Boeremia exigua TaxID=749465 RepID=UPI001E8EA233|nr:uncharacterized protein C7974DRAFT_445297 [Boeremia exigua]KAH6612560.1 hypothetical protein C7974DRAFT_445297 [Boeremia exigua]
MADHSMTAASDAASIDSFDLAPNSPLTKEKTRAAHASWILELEQRPEFRLLSELVQNPDATPDDAVQQLVNLTHQSALEETIGNHCWMTACSFLEVAARSAPGQQAKLIALLLSLRSVILTDSSTDEPWTFEDGAGVVWQDLPTFGYTIADEMGSFDGQDPDYTQEEAHKWENLTAFLAQIDSSVSESPSVLDFSASWAPTAFAWAFEGDSESAQSSELAVRLACIWLIYDSGKLWSKVRDSELNSNTRERWEAWRQGLKDCRTRFACETTTPMLIANALAQMQIQQVQHIHM